MSLVHITNPNNDSKRNLFINNIDVEGSINTPGFSSNNIVTSDFNLVDGSICVGAGEKKIITTGISISENNLLTDGSLSCSSVDSNSLSTNSINTNDFVDLTISTTNNNDIVISNNGNGLLRVNRESRLSNTRIQNTTNAGTRFIGGNSNAEWISTLSYQSVSDRAVVIGSFNRAGEYRAIVGGHLLDGSKNPIAWAALWLQSDAPAGHPVIVGDATTANANLNSNRLYIVGNTETTGTLRSNNIIFTGSISGPGIASSGVAYGRVSSTGSIIASFNNLESGKTITWSTTGTGLYLGTYSSALSDIPRSVQFCPLLLPGGGSPRIIICDSNLASQISIIIYDSTFAPVDCDFSYNIQQ